LIKESFMSFNVGVYHIAIRLGSASEQFIVGIAADRIVVDDPTRAGGVS